MGQFRKTVSSFTPTKGPTGSVYALGEGENQKVYVRTPFGHRFVQEPVGTALIVRQHTLYLTIRALTKRLLLLMGLSFVVGLALGLWTR